MATKTINEKPTIADQIVFDILTPGADGCFTSNPYKVNKVTIYHAVRTFNSDNFGEYTKEIQDTTIASDLAAAKTAACTSATDENLAEVARLEALLEAHNRKDTFYFSEARVVATFGDETMPAWLSTDTDNAFITNIPTDDDGDTQYGHFQLEWSPLAVREGDYFICWTWTPQIAGDSLQSHQHFTLYGNTQLTTSIPTHFTDPLKYETLFERYTPEMFKLTLCDGDLTPEVIQELNNSAGDAFTFLEDLANQMVDLIDANATHESLLNLLSNIFNLKLRTNDPTLWRRQIKEAVPLFKKKGTLSGLTDALSQAGMVMTKLTHLWQVISPYTYQEVFDVSEDDQEEFTLTNVMVLPLDTDNFELYYRAVGSSTWTTLTSDYATFATSSGVTTMTWVGNDLSVSAVELSEGDSVRIVYEIVEVPSTAQQTIEDYIRSLPLSDLRDERSQTYPPKNWNVRLIEEDDAMFDVIIPDRHPFVDPLIWGQVRTEIPYSENIYNMEEYNGSIRDSTDPCDIDKDFLDPCKACRSSKFNVDIEIEELSNDRILEAKEIIQEFTPFHANLHTLNFSGTINEFVNCQEEDITMLLNVSREEKIISGGAQMIFNRAMTSLSQLKRNALASTTTVVSSASGTACNDAIVIYTPEIRLDEIGIDESSNVLEILAPSPLAGTYSISNRTKSHAEVSGSITEPFTSNSFTFRLSNDIFTSSVADVYQDDYFTFADDNVDFSLLGVKSNFDVEFDSDYSGGAWTVTISAYSDTYTVENVLPNGSLILLDPSATLPTSSTTGISYVLKNDSGTTITSSSTGDLTVKRRGRIDLVDESSLDDIRNITKIGDYLLLSSTQYKISGFVDGDDHEFYIDNYTSGDASGATINIYRRMVDSEIGYLDYKGLMLTAAADHEAGLGINNGANPPGSEDDILEDDSFKENFLVLIDSEYFAISQIDGTTITLNGPDNDWETSAGGGTSVTYSILKYSKEAFSVAVRDYPPTPAHDFTGIDRRGQDIITADTETAVSMLSIFNLQESGGGGIDQFVSPVSQQEQVSFKIERKDGSVEEGVL